MDIAALIVAIVALLFAVSAAGFGVYIQFQTYKATTDHLRGVEASVSGFRTEMQGLVGELKGMTHTLVEAQQQQFNRMLDAFVTRPGAAAEVAERTGESADRLQQISEGMEALKQEVRHAASADDVQQKLEELAGRLEAVSQSTVRAARLAEAAASGPAPRAGPELAHLPLFRVNIEPIAVPTGEPVTITVILFVPPDLVTSVECAVKSPGGRAWVLAVPGRKLRPGPLQEFAFPQAFEGASTDEAGAYHVRVAVRTTLWPTEVYSDAFTVTPGEEGRTQGA